MSHNCHDQLQDKQHEQLNPPKTSLSCETHCAKDNGRVFGAQAHSLPHRDLPKPHPKRKEKLVALRLSIENHTNLASRMRTALALCRSAFVYSMPSPRPNAHVAQHARLGLAPWLADSLHRRNSHARGAATGTRTRAQMLQQIQRFAREPTHSSAVAIKIFDEIKDTVCPVACPQQRVLLCLRP